VRPDAFTSKDRGTVRKDLAGYWAFHPEPLPRRIDLSQDVVNLLDEATGAVHRLASAQFATPMITPGQAERVLDVTRPTAQAAIEALVERGDLTEITQRGRGRIYEATRIVDAVYGSVEMPGAGQP